MARTFRRHRQAHPISELNVTNLIDLAFTLLIIFMLATPLIEPEQTHPVNLPVESVSTQPPTDPETTFEAVTIDRQGNYIIGPRTLSERELDLELARWAAQPKPPVIRIRADAQVPYQSVATLLEHLKKNGLGRLNFDTQVRP